MANVSRETLGSSRAHAERFGLVGSEGRLSQHDENAIQITNGGKINRDLALSCPKVDLHACVQTVAQAFGDLIEVPLALSG